MTYFFRSIQAMIALMMTTSIAYGYEGDWASYNECCPCKPVCCGKVYIGAEALYWRPFQSGIDECIPLKSSDTISSDGFVSSTFKGKGRDHHFRWDPGYRIGLGYSSGSNCWDIGATWTHFDSNHSQRKAHRWSIKLDVVDLIVGYNTNQSSCFSLRPFAGVRGVRIEEKLHLGHFSKSSNIGSKNRNKERLSGIGPLVGLEANFDVNCGFSLYANASVSWLYGRFRLTFKEAHRTADSFDFCDVSRRVDANIAATDAGVGVRWQKCFCKNMNLILQLGLEHHRYFDFNRFGNYGDLSFDGVNFSAGIGF